MGQRRTCFLTQVKGATSLSLPAVYVRVADPRPLVSAPSHHSQSPRSEGSPLLAQTSLAASGGHMHGLSH